LQARLRNSRSTKDGTGLNDLLAEGFDDDACGGDLARTFWRITALPPQNLEALASAATRDESCLNAITPLLLEIGGAAILPIEKLLADLGASNDALYREWRIGAAERLLARLNSGTKDVAKPENTPPATNRRTSVASQTSCTHLREGH